MGRFQIIDGALFDTDNMAEGPLVDLNPALDLLNEQAAELTQAESDYWELFYEC